MRCTLAVIAAAVAGCSTFSGAPRINAHTATVECSTALPIIDTAGVAITATLFVALVSEEGDSTFALGLVSVPILYTLSAIYGFGHHGQCLKYRRSRTPQDYAVALGKLAESQAEAGHCADALATRERVKELEPAYYAIDLARKPAIARCISDAGAR